VHLLTYITIMVCLLGDDTGKYAAIWQWIHSHYKITVCKCLPTVVVISYGSHYRFSVHFTSMVTEIYTIYTRRCHHTPANSFSKCRLIFTMRRYASTVYAVVLYLSIHPSVCLEQVLYQNG